jgi:hypothetical protein
MDDNFYIQGISIILQEVNSKWHLSLKWSFIKFIWVWFSCYDRIIEHVEQIGLDMITCHFTCPMPYKPLYVNCFKPFKTTLRKRKTMQWLETICVHQKNAHSLVGWKRHWMTLCPKKPSRMGLGLWEFGHSIPRLWMTRPTQMKSIQYY